MKNDQTIIVKGGKAGVLAAVAGGILLAAGCVVQPNGQVTLGFPVVVYAPPVVAVEAPEPMMVPDTYVWDGYENVGYVGGQYFYLGPGNVWLVADPYRMDRFHGWERGHPDWRDHGIRNDHFRNDRNGHFQPRGRAPAKGPPRRDDHGH